MASGGCFSEKPNLSVGEPSGHTAKDWSDPSDYSLDKTEDSVPGCTLGGAGFGFWFLSPIVKPLIQPS